MKSFHYNLYLFDSEEPMELSFSQGEKLAMVLISQNAPKFILIDDDVINANSIKELRKIEDRITKPVYLPNVGDRIKDLGPAEMELAEEEKSIHSNFLSMKNQLHKNLFLDQ